MTETDENKKMTPKELEESKMLFKRALLESKVKDIEKILSCHPHTFTLKRKFKLQTNRRWRRLGGDEKSLPYPDADNWLERLKSRRECKDVNAISNGQAKK